MYLLKKFHGARFDKFNTIVSSLHGHLTENINLVGSATLPFPEICQATSLPGAAVRVEGMLEKRYFPGTDPLDCAENLAIEGIRSLFDIDSSYAVNIQPHSATQANHAVWRAILKPGDLVIGLSTSDGGHISHSLGLPPGVSFQPIPTCVGGIDYKATLELIVELKPRMVVIGSSSYPLAIDYPTIGKLTDSLGIHLHADIAHTAPYIMSGHHPAVFPYADTVTVDTGKNLRGPKGGVLLYRKELSKVIQRSIFPIIQSSPNQSAMLAKACLFEMWTRDSIKSYSERSINDSRVFANKLEYEGVSLVYKDTESHLVLINTHDMGLTGKRAEMILSESKILSNRNSIPNDTLDPLNASGLRFGITTLTLLNYEEPDISSLAKHISRSLLNRSDIKGETSRLIKKYHTRTSKISN